MQEDMRIDKDKYSDCQIETIQQLVNDLGTQLDSILDSPQDDVIAFMIESNLSIHDIVSSVETLSCDNSIIDCSDLEAGSSTDYIQTKSQFLNKAASSICDGLKANLFRIHEKQIDFLIKTQAELLWHFKGCPSQDIKGQNDDYYNAKRYLSFVIMDSIVQKCRGREPCLLLSLPSMFFQMLQGVTIEDYIRYTAYLRWLNRSKFQEKDYEHGQFLQTLTFGDYEDYKTHSIRPDTPELRWTEKEDHLNDYDFALHYLDSAFQCMCSTFLQSSNGFRRVVDKALPYYKNNLQLIIDSKIKTYSRLCGIDSIDKNVSDKIDHYVGKYLYCIEHIYFGKSPRIRECIDLISFIQKEHKIVNIFEYLTRTLLFKQIGGNMHSEYDRDINSHRY